MKEKSSPSNDEENKVAQDQPVQPAAADKAPQEGLHWPKQAPAIQEEKMPSQRTGRWILGVLAALIVGFGVAFFVLTLPAWQELKQVKADLTSAQEKLSAAEAKLKTTSASLDSTEKDLAEAQYAVALGRVQTNVAYARASLVSRDLLTARQEVSAAVTNLQALLPFLSDKTVREALTERMKGIDKALSTDSAKALEELRILSENLLRLEEQQ